jgi:hypothetical protein
MTVSTVRVERSAAWLDEVRPDWLNRVNLDALNMLSPERCIAGQVFADQPETPPCDCCLGHRSGYNAARKMLKAQGLDKNLYAFDSHEDHDAWVALITQRRNEQTAGDRA